ncbi:MAG: hypothetical protein EON98_00260 [Chitinophagaceae bacterium]|nr:MAG: hypothetical protein EON98_00260 [Chitinophagaceae bacterium]
MEAYNDNRNETLEQFLNTHPLGSLREMSIEKYADLEDHNSFCYWLEYGSKGLGQIGGMPLTKFGLWKPKSRKDFDEMYESDSTYAWNAKYGNNRATAFKKIINIVADIANAAYEGDWDQVESIDFHSVAKWKVAFLYSEKRIFPVYTREGLLSIASGLKGRFPENTSILTLQEYIIDKKPEDVDMLDYATSLWQHYVVGKSFRNYFIVGSKYKGEDGKDTRDIFPDMLATNSIAIGFLWDHDMSHLVGTSDEEINRFIEVNGDEDGIDKSKLKSYFKILLNLKPGDIIAVKSHGSHGNLKIIAYGVVVEREGKVYEHRKSGLGHHINVDFIELDINRTFTYNYAGTIHHVKNDKLDHLKAIFGPFLQVDNIALDSEDDSTITEDGRLKSENSYHRGPVAAKMVLQLHNIIQNSFYKDLKEKFPKDTITLEFGGRVDIVRESNKERFLYEIKPFENVIGCLREATGQLLEYAFRFPSPKPTTLIVVGPGEVKGEATQCLDHLSEVISYPFQYIRHVAPYRRKIE